jgi:putative ABC transport system permease protein
MMHAIFQDLRFGIRTMAKDGTFTLVAILTLGLALGANVAIFSVVNGILLEPLPYGQPDRLVRVNVIYRPAVGESSYVSYPNLADLRTQSKSFEGLAIYTAGGSFIHEGSEPEHVSGMFVNADTLRLLHVRPRLGRIFTDQDDRWGAPKQLILSHDLWARAFHSDPHIVGKQIKFGVTGTPRTVIGVMPAGFQFPIGNPVREYWLPLHAEIPASDMHGRGAVWLQSVARLRNGVTAEQASADLHRIGVALQKQYPDTNTDVNFGAEPYHKALVRKIKPAVLLLMGAVVTVLLIGCANVANLLLARASGRRREIAIRSAVGATRGRVIAQLLAESVLLSVVAGACGLVIATWGVDVLKAFAPPNIPRIDAISVDTRVVLFALGLSALTGILFGIAPALHASNADLNETLKEGTRGSTEGRSRNRVRNTLVTAAIALSLVLLAGAGLLIRSFVLLTSVDPGFDYQHTIYAQVAARQNAYPDAARQMAFSDRILEAMRRIPGVTAAGATDSPPLGPAESSYSFVISGRAIPKPGDEPSETFSVITPGYFQTLAIPMRRGRDFTDRDTASAPLVVIVSQAFADKYFKGRDAIGQKITIHNGVKGEREIVGIAGDVHFEGLNEDLTPMLYAPFKQQPDSSLDYIVRSPAAASLEPAMRQAIHQLDREQPIGYVRRIADLRDESLATRRFNLILLTGLSVLAVLLAAVGIYSLMSYTVTQRTSEIGIRMALGAGTSDVFRLIVGNALRLVGVGVIVGVGVALAATRVMQSLLFGVGANDPVTFVGICIVISAVALIASWLPARRAARVDPLVAMRYD